MEIIFHIDVNSAYLSWTAVEQLKNGASQDLRTVPSIIGGDQKSRHGVVLAESQPAKKYGIQTGEPVVNAFRKCPNLITARPDHKLYSRYSHQLMDYLRTISPVIEQVSVDECYLDYGKAVRPSADYLTAADTIRREVRERFGFTVNVGISTRKLLAKMASDFEKPDKTHTLFPEEIREKMWPLPVGELHMAGKSSVAVMNKLEIYTIGDLAAFDPDLLELHLKSHGRKLWEFANGIDDRVVKSERDEAKNVGNSTTLKEDLVTMEEARRVLGELAASVSRRLKKAGQKAGSINVEIKYYDFTTASHQRQLSSPADDEQTIRQTAAELFDECWDREPVRLLGIRTAKLSDAGEPEQLTLFDVQDEIIKSNKKKEKRDKIEAALDTVKKKYGEEIVHKGIKEREHE